MVRTFRAALLQVATMWRAPGKFRGDGQQIEPMLFLKGRLTDPMLLGVMQVAQADGPAVRRLKPGATIRAGPHIVRIRCEAGYSPEPNNSGTEPTPGVPSISGAVFPSRPA